MIKRKIDSTMLVRIKEITENYQHTGDISEDALKELFTIVFEDIVSVVPVFIHADYDDMFEWWSGNEVFEEVCFAGGDVRYFYIEIYENLLQPIVIRLSNTMLAHREKL